jgi:hypothetical protein
VTAASLVLPLVLDPAAAVAGTAEVVAQAAVAEGDLPSTHLPALDPLYRKPWMVYSKPPFGSPKQVLAYLARYTHRVALTNQRLVRITDKEVTFTWKDYADAETPRQMTLSGEEFLRRFLLHVLPDRFVRIRYFGLFANRHRERMVALCRKVLPGPPSPKPTAPAPTWQERLHQLTGMDPLVCTVCGQRTLRCIEPLAPVRRRGPPAS